MKTISQYIYKTELHAHTAPVSPCADFSPAEVVRKYKKLGYSSIMITNHFFSSMPGYGEKRKAVSSYIADFEAAKEEGDKSGINVILGCEIRFTENSNDYLLYGIEKDELYDIYDYIGGGLEAFSKDFRNSKRMIIQAHPFRDGNELADISLLDGIETFNIHPHHNSRIALASQIVSENKNLIATTGTDFHHEGHQGLSALLTKRELKNGADVTGILKSRDYLFKILDHIVLPYGE